MRRDGARGRVIRAPSERKRAARQRVNRSRRRRFAQGEFISPEHWKSKGPHSGPGRNGNGGKDPLMVDNALAMVDNVVSMKLGL